MDALFEVHKLNDEGMKRAEKLAAIFEGALREIEALNPMDGRELSIVKTKLEEACFFAKKALAKNAAHQK